MSRKEQILEIVAQTKAANDISGEKTLKKVQINRYKVDCNLYGLVTLWTHAQLLSRFNRNDRFEKEDFFEQVKKFPFREAEEAVAITDILSEYPHFNHLDWQKLRGLLNITINGEKIKKAPFVLFELSIVNRLLSANTKLSKGDNDSIIVSYDNDGITLKETFQSKDVREVSIFIERYCEEPLFSKLFI